MTPRLLGAFLALLLLLLAPGLARAAEASADLEPFPRPIATYADDPLPVLQKLGARIAAEPFNLVATVIFLLAIGHTFLAARFMAIAHRYEHALDHIDVDAALADPRVGRQRDRLRFRATLFHFFGEVEAVFGIWLIPLVLAIISFHGWDTMVRYFDHVKYTEPIFVFAIMAIASTKPVLRFAERNLAFVANLGGGTPAAWWVSILTVGPILGSFITEPAAMTICALLLLERFYKLKPTMGLRYATLGLLFVNISVGGTLTHFAAPPVVMVADAWNWGTVHMFTHFGWKAVLGILTANGIYFLWFRRELLGLAAPAAETSRAEAPIPLGITLVHLGAIAWTVLNSHHPALVLLGLLFFLAFLVATERHQSAFNIRSPLLVGFFLAALVIHGGCQQWWIAPVLGGLTEWPLMIGSTLLTAVNDNAAITYLATLVPGFTDELKYAVVAGAVTGGGLTVIANAPNPAGQSILGRQFEDGGVHPLRLLLAALLPTIVMGAAFMLLPS